VKHNIGGSVVLLKFCILVASFCFVYHMQAAPNYMNLYEASLSLLIS